MAGRGHIDSGLAERLFQRIDDRTQCQPFPLDAHHPAKQDIESCDRVGVIQMLPAGDAEKDVEGRRWEQRKELMRDVIIYTRNNPSILFTNAGTNPSAGST